MAQFKKAVHPLGWGDTELNWLLTCGPDGKGLTNRAIYHAMGYKGRQPTPVFLLRLQQQRQKLEEGKS